MYLFYYFLYQTRNNTLLGILNRKYNQNQDCPERYQSHSHPLHPTRNAEHILQELKLARNSQFHPKIQRQYQVKNSSLHSCSGSLLQAVLRSYHWGHTPNKFLCPQYSCIHQDIISLSLNGSSSTHCL